MPVICMENLMELRKEVDEVDASIIELVAKRFTITNEIGNIKRASGLKVHDPEREAFLLKRWSEQGKKYGLEKDITLPILEHLLKFSKAKEAYQKDPKNIVVLGTGSMAEALGMLARNAGHSVYVRGRNSEKEKKLAELIGANILPTEEINTDYIILCVPPAAFTKETIKLVSNCQGGILMDISSSKTEYLEKAAEFASEAGMKIISTHPLFGLEDARRGSSIAIITDGKAAKDVEAAANFWTSTGLVAIKMSIEEHEKAMAVSQVLRHAYALGFYDSVSELSNMLKIDYGKACTAKFMQMLENAKAIKSEEWVAAEIAKSNSYSKLVYEIAEKNLQKHASGMIL